MKRKRKCRGCQELFRSDARSCRPSGNGRKESFQRYCSKSSCRKTSHRVSNKTYWKTDDEARARNVVACRTWRQNNKGYWKGRREEDPEYTRRNRELQRRRDAKVRGDLANTDTIEALRCDKLKRIGILIDLANTDSKRVSWTLVAEEIRLFLAWVGRLANTNSIDRSGRNYSQSPA